MVKEKKKLVYIVIIVLAAALTAALLLIHFLGGARQTPAPAPTPEPPTPTPEVIIREVEKEKIVEVEKEITAQILRDGLRDMGVLVTEEYYFTEVISFSRMASLDIDLKIFRLNGNIPFTESSFLASYDGVVNAGVDLAAVTVRKDDAQGIIVVELPPAEILNVDIQPESFQLYDEKNGLGTRITLEDYNDALIRLESSAADKAAEKGLLQRAEENAKTVIRNFIAGFTGPGSYTVVFTAAGEA